MSKDAVAQPEKRRATSQRKILFLGNIIVLSAEEGRNFCVAGKKFVYKATSPIPRARTTIRQSLDPFLDRYIRFYQGDEILAQFSEFCPERTAVDDFLRSSVALQNQLKGVEVSARIIAGVRQLVFRQVDGVAEPEQWLLELNLNLEAITEEMGAKLKAFGEEGGSISLPRTTFQVAKFPEILALAGVDTERFSDFTLIQIAKDIGAYTLRKTDEENRSTSLEHIPLSTVSSGSVRLRLANKDETSACKFMVDIDRAAQTVSVTFAPLVLGQNAFAAYRAFAFLDALSKRGRLSLVNDQTGIAIIDEVIEGGPSRVNPLQLNLLRKPAAVQQKTGRTITINREILGTDIADIESAFVAVTEGRLFFEPEPIIINAKSGETLNHYPPDMGSFVLVPPDQRRVITVLDNEIDLGETEIVVNNAVLEIDEGGKSGRFIPRPGEPFYINFVKYSGERKHLKTGPK